MPTALLSVYHKDGIVEFAQGLVALGWDILASGGTAKTLAAGGVPVRDVSELVGGGAILGHRVVTLSREVHAGLLARRPEDEAEMAALGLPYIDLVCVDLYPLKKEIGRINCTLESVIEMTDIGGPTMLRSAAKGNRIVICDPSDRQSLLDWLNLGQPDCDIMINNLAAKAEYVIAQYCLDSARYRGGGYYDGTFVHPLTDCCYGENRWQSPARLFSTETQDLLALEEFQLIAGSKPSYINYCDIDRLLQTITHTAAVFDKNRDTVPLIAVGCKHGNPCGAAVGDNAEEVIDKMVMGDPLAIFGGLIMTNFVITDTIAALLLGSGVGQSKRIFDGVIAPSFTERAVIALQRKNDRCRLYENEELLRLTMHSLNQEPIRRPVRGGVLIQPNYTFVLDLSDPLLEKSQMLPIGYQET